MIRQCSEMSQWSELRRSTESLIIFMGAPAPGAPMLPTPLLCHHFLHAAPIPTLVVIFIPLVHAIFSSL